MFRALFGSAVKERVLLYLTTHGDGYPRELATALGHGLLGIQRHLRRLEDGGVVCSRLRGRVRLYSLDPRWPFQRELLALLRRALQFLPPDERERTFSPRRRPRRPGKDAA